MPARSHYYFFHNLDIQHDQNNQNIQATCLPNKLIFAEDLPSILSFKVDRGKNLNIFSPNVGRTERLKQIRTILNDHHKNRFSEGFILEAKFGDDF